MTRFSEMDTRIAELEKGGDGTVNGTAGQVAFDVPNFGGQGAEAIEYVSSVTDLYSWPTNEMPGRFYYDSKDILYYLDRTYYLSPVFPQSAIIKLVRLSGSNEMTKFGWVNSWAELDSVNYGDMYYNSINEYKHWNDKQLKPIKTFYAEITGPDPMAPTGDIVVEYRVLEHETGWYDSAYTVAAIIDKYAFVLTGTPSEDTALFKTTFDNPAIPMLMSSQTNVAVGFVKKVDPFIGDLIVGKRTPGSTVRYGWLDGAGTLNNAAFPTSLTLPVVLASGWVDNKVRKLKIVEVSLDSGKYEMTVLFTDESSDFRMKPGKTFKVQAFGKTWNLTKARPRGDGLELVISAADYNLWASEGKKTTIKLGWDL